MATKKVIFFFLLPVLVSFFLHLHVFRLDTTGYHVWRQSQTQMVIYNFSVSDNNIFHPQKLDITDGSTRLLYEFPLYQWLIAQVNHALGYSVLHTRAISFTCFIFLLLGFYKLQVKFFKKEIALISNALLCFSPLLYYYCVNPLPDMLALCLAVWSLYFFFGFLGSGKTTAFLWFSLMLMLAALVKLPYIIFGSVLIPYVVKAFRQKEFPQLIKNSFIFLASLVPVAAWYLKAIPTWGNNHIAEGMLSNRKSLLELLDIFQFHLISSVPELLTNYAACLFLVTGIYLFFKNRKALKEVHRYFVVLFFACSLYFFSEMNMIEKVHDYYLMPFIPLLFLVVSYGVKFYYERQRKWIIWTLVCLVPLTAWLRINHRWGHENPGFVPDYRDQQAYFNALIPKEALCIIDYDDSKCIALYYLKRHGFCFYKLEMNPAKLMDRYEKGGRYLFTENLSLDVNTYGAFIFKELYSGELKIYELALKQNGAKIPGK